MDLACSLFFSFFPFWRCHACSCASAAVQRWKSFIGPQCDEDSLPVSIYLFSNDYAGPLLTRTLHVLITYQWRSISEMAKAPILTLRYSPIIRYARCSREQPNSIPRFTPPKVVFPSAQRTPLIIKGSITGRTSAHPNQRAPDWTRDNIRASPGWPLARDLVLNHVMTLTPYPNLHA